MPLGVSSVQWDMRIAWGGKVAWAFSLFNPAGIEPFPPAGHTFEWLVKQNVSDSSPLIKVTSDGSPSPASAGTLTVQSTAVLTSVILTLQRPATTGLSAPFSGYHALWMDYADANNAVNLLWGQFYLDPSIQPA